MPKPWAGTRGPPFIAPRVTDRESTMKKEPHSLETMRQLKDAALTTHDEVQDGMSRRQALKNISAASAVLALGLSGCERKPRRKIVSRALAPEYQKPGKALYYSSTYTDHGFPYGMMIKVVDGRPVKVEGNPDHPVNLGTSTAQMQASILSLYDPDRLRTPILRGQSVDWTTADAAVMEALNGAKSVVLMTRSTLGPSEQALVKQFSEKWSATHLVHDVFHDTNRRKVWKKIYGAPGEWLPQYDKAEVILSLDCDFLGTEGAVLESTRAFQRNRKLQDESHADASMSRLYMAEGAMTVTGSNADYRLPLRSSALGALAQALMSGAKDTLNSVAEKHHLDGALLNQLADELKAHPGKAVVVAGEHLPASVHEAVALLNEALQAPGKTLAWNSATAALPTNSAEEIRAAFDTKPDVAIFLGVNPVYDFPGGGFDALLSKTAFSIGHGLYVDETLSACTVALPSAHMLESWNDVHARDGLWSLTQPVLSPLFDGRQEADSLLQWFSVTEDFHGYLKQRWEAMTPSWEKALRTGIWQQNAPSPTTSLNRTESLLGSVRKEDGFELILRPHHGIVDGRFANNAWLQELPDPVSKLVWENALSMSPKTAEGLGVQEGDIVSVQVGETTVELPVLVQPGMATGVLQTSLGHGRTHGGAVALEASGVNVTAMLPRLALNAKVAKVSGRHELVRTQTEFSMYNRPIALDGVLSEYHRESDFVKHKRHVPESVELYEPFDYSKGHKWEMVIDLSACTGCGACMVACQAENNIPVVGKKECGNGREMHWIRVDRYEDGNPDNPKISHQPMLCQHCDNAPCENVCPVNATAHSPEGINEMTYNRCVGTRYCANNCPYKVRRFNFLHYQENRLKDPVQELGFNPQVTVRGVGVMEKCTFCVQRINEAKFAAEKPGEKVTVKTACQQACPAQAIVFGDVNDPESDVAKLKQSGRAYLVLEELNVKPSVAYLAKVRNVEDDGTSEDGGHHA
jgi:Fe-S-cluster-containing dehydrogenase component